MTVLTSKPSNDDETCSCGNTEVLRATCFINKTGEPLELGHMYNCYECKKAWTTPLKNLKNLCDCVYCRSRREKKAMENSGEEDIT